MIEPTDHVCSRTVLAVRPPQADGWSAGYFSITGYQLPHACLAHCLGGDPRRAATDGCRFIRDLVRKFSDLQEGRTTCAPEVPVSHVCARGYHVSAQRASVESDLILLVLHPPLEHGDQPVAVHQAVEALQRATLENWRLSQENEGLANEVLQCYEQVNLIFDISGETARLTEESQVRRVILAKLQAIYDADQVLCIDPPRNVILSIDRNGRVLSTPADRLGSFLDRSGRLRKPGERFPRNIDDIPLPPETAGAIQRLHVAPRAFVAMDTDPELRKRGQGTSLWGSIRYDHHRFATVGVIRRSRPFEAGEMLLLGSTLTFGSHMLANMGLVEQLKQAGFESVRALVNAIDQKDAYTSGHSERVGFLARNIGRLMGLPTTQLRELEWGGLLHDIGKIGIPERILNKKGRLSEYEMAIVRDHPARGYAILKPVASLAGILDIVLHHHETPDGKGYPDGLTGDEIPLLARIVHVADTFDALTSTRPYRQAYDHQRALSIMEKETGTKLDPHVMAFFVKLLERLPHEHPMTFRKWFASNPPLPEPDPTSTPPSDSCPGASSA